VRSFRGRWGSRPSGPTLLPQAGGGPAAAAGVHLRGPGRVTRWRVALPVAAVVIAGGILGTYRYLDNFWVYRGFSPPQDPAYVKTRGTTETILVASPALGGRRQQVVVYLPPGYQTSGRRYPVMYLLHGSPGKPWAFIDTVGMGVVVDSLVARGRTKGVILVAPYGSTGPFTDKEWANGVRRNEAWENFLAHDVVRAIDRRYRTVASAAGRTIAGLSEGGYGALNIGFHHPAEFSVIESWSGYAIADTIPSIFGRSAARLVYNSPALYLPKVAPELRARGTYVWLYSGSRDTLRLQNALFARELTRYRIPHTFFVDRGGHTWKIWRSNAERSVLTAVGRMARG